MLMKNINISFQDKIKKLKFEEYYFNGIQTPKNIQFKNISSNSIEVYWEIDDLKILNIDNKKINFKIEFRNQNKKFEQIYEGNNKYYLIENLNKDTNYEIRICCIYNNLIGSWSEIKNVKTKSIDSIILKESKREDEFIKILLEWMECKGIELIYRGTRGGTTSNTFHNKCDNQGPTLCLYKNEKGNIFGGYTSISWTNSKETIYKSDPYSFIFTLTNIYNTQPTKFSNLDQKENIRHSKDKGPTFGGYNADFACYEDFNIKDDFSAFPGKYKDILKKGKSIFTGNFDNKIEKFKIKEIEVFKPFK